MTAATPAPVATPATPRRFYLPENWREQVDVLVVGCGGTGSEIVDALCRLDHVLRQLEHPGLRITLMDGDTVSPSNLGRQRFLSCDLGRNKAETLARRYGLLLGVDIHYAAWNLERRHFDYLRTRQLVITAVDRASVRTAIADHHRQRTSETLWLDTGNGASTGQVVFGHLAGRRAMPSAERLPHVLDLFPGIRTTPDNAEPSCSVAEALRAQHLGVNRFIADAAVFSILAPLFTQGMIEHHGALIDMAKPVVSPLKIDPKAWAFFGYSEVAPAPVRKKAARR